MGPSSGSSANVTIYEPPPPIPIPKFGEWPTFYAPSWLRNGREAGCWLAAVVSVIPEKCAHVTVGDDHIAGAVHAMVEGGLQVKSFSHRDGETTFEVRSIHHEFVEA
jgi:hypothetical protein